ncbi:MULTISPECIES: hypothetical protein [unclassified Moorena]|uniref:hypothetical protein n=1 Tax=unclassified Moorena TaxID=2683338 RepID=UPI0013FEF217|nr:MULTISPECIES: hypothetical protein [unclassified Moorena]NEO11816.1 hypothetical protein [Moorena sp. SIO3E8]NEP98735.1 hypothetical protein [Moorena sp. SIO3F7]
MSYSDFKSLDTLASLGIDMLEPVPSLIQADPISPSDFLQEALKRFVPLATAINTEKARSEYLIAPILSEITVINPPISLFSGKNFNVDPAQGLTGFFDFILTDNPDKLTIKAPVVVVVEAKNENINEGLPQCLATMYAARLVNQKEPEMAERTVYGTVTTGQVWRFLALTPEGKAMVDLNDRYLTPVDELLGVLVAMTTR